MPPDTCRAICTDCSWEFRGNQQVAVADALEKHAQKERHHVEFHRLQAASP